MENTLNIQQNNIMEIEKKSCQGDTLQNHYARISTRPGAVYTKSEVKAYVLGFSISVCDVKERNILHQIAIQKMP